MKRVPLTLVMAVVALLPACRPSASRADLMEKVVSAVEVYYTTSNADEAEKAMLELEILVTNGKAAGVSGLDFDQVYAALYSRLYRVQSYLGKQEHALENYRRAKEHWEKHYSRRGFSYTVEDIQEQIEIGAQHFGNPKWEISRHD
jgi:hypothetical protein